MKRIYHSYIPNLLQESAYIQLYSSFFRFCCVQSSYVPSCKLFSEVISEYGDVVIDSRFCNIVHFSNVQLFIFPPKDENFGLKKTSINIQFIYTLAFLHIFIFLIQTRISEKIAISYISVLSILLGVRIILCNFYGTQKRK